MPFSLLETRRRKIATPGFTMPYFDVAMAGYMFPPGPHVKVVHHPLDIKKIKLFRRKALLDVSQSLSFSRPPLFRKRKLSTKRIC